MMQMQQNVSTAAECTAAECLRHPDPYCQNTHLTLTSENFVLLNNDNDSALTSKVSKSPNLRKFTTLGDKSNVIFVCLFIQMSSLRHKMLHLVRYQTTRRATIVQACRRVRLRFTGRWNGRIRMGFRRRRMRLRQNATGVHRPLHAPFCDF